MARLLPVNFSSNLTDQTQLQTTHVVKTYGTIVDVIALTFQSHAYLLVNQIHQDLLAARAMDLGCVAAHHI